MKNWVSDACMNRTWELFRVMGERSCMCIGVWASTAMGPADLSQPGKTTKFL